MTLSGEVLEIDKYLAEAKEKLEEAVEAFRVAWVIADCMTGHSEIGHIVSGQLDSYTIPTLELFIESSQQPGSIANLYESLRTL